MDGDNDMTFKINQAWSAFEREDLPRLLKLDIEVHVKEQERKSRIKKRNYYKQRETELLRELIA